MKCPGNRHWRTAAPEATRPTRSRKNSLSWRAILKAVGRAAAAVHHICISKVQQRQKLVQGDHNSSSTFLSMQPLSASWCWRSLKPANQKIIRGCIAGFIYHLNAPKHRVNGPNLFNSPDNSCWQELAKESIFQFVQKCC